MYVKMLGVASYFPRRSLSNYELASIVSTNDEWIHSRTGIRKRYIADHSETALVLGTRAAQKALSESGIAAHQIDYIISTGTPDSIIPNQATLLQKNLGISQCPCLDIQAACSGFVYALDLVYSLIQSGRYRYILVVSSELCSRYLDWNDRATCVLFGDAAGAAVLGVSNTPGILGIHLTTDSQYTEIISLTSYMDNGCIVGSPYIMMDGRSVFKLAVQMLEKSIRELLQKHNKQVNDIHWFILHQANLRIIKAVAERLNVPLKRFAMTISDSANTSSATIPIALSFLVESSQLYQGHMCILAAIGGSMSWGSVLMEW